ncbi:MAG: exo-alpha-sialidase [Bryobacterales bacterium]|nr:exo-alpha-sialidase [Bryobacterales bacterium]
MRLVASLLFIGLAIAHGGEPAFLNLLPPRPGNPRNTEGDFIQLKDGRLLFVYTKFTGGGGDHDAAHLAGRYSSNGGRTWTSDDVVVLEREGDMNVMSVSLLRLRDGRIALFYLRKNSETDCHVWMRTSNDEARTWSESVRAVTDSGYYVLNNDRAVQLRSGRIVLPVALHTADSQWTGRGLGMVYLSDDAGKTWRRSKQVVECPTPSPTGLQEPGIVELKDGRLMMFFRTRLGSQYISYSRDGGDTWTKPGPSKLLSPVSPASIERIPKTGHLLAVWNDHTDIDESFRARDTGETASGGKRTPLTVAISRDEGKTWEKRKHIRDAPDGWYCYTAIDFVGDNVLLAYVAGGEDRLARLSRTQVAVLPVEWIYQ